MTWETVDFYWSQPHYLDHLWSLGIALGNHGIRAIQRPHSSVAIGDTEPLADDGTPTIIAGHGDLSHVPASRPVALVSHGVDQTYEGVDHGAYTGGRDRERISLFVCPSYRSVEINRNRYPNAEHALAGPLRLDPLLRDRAAWPGPRWGLGHTEDEPIRVGFAWHHDSTICHETRHAAPYYWPTLERLAGNDRYEIIGHGHPRDRHTWKVEYGAIGVTHEPNPDRLLANVDLLAADNTSLLYEAAALGIPTLTLDAPWYRPDVHHRLRFWDAVPGWRLAARSDSPTARALFPEWGRDHLGDAVEMALYDPTGAGREAHDHAMRVAYGDGSGGTLLDGRSAERAARAVVEWLEVS